jgi:hypothetical protein
MIFKRFHCELIPIFWFLNSEFSLPDIRRLPVVCFVLPESVGCSTLKFPWLQFFTVLWEQLRQELLRRVIVMAYKPGERMIYERFECELIPIFWLSNSYLFLEDIRCLAKSYWRSSVFRVCR